MRVVLGTFVEAVATGHEPIAAAAIDAAFAELEALHALLSFQDPESELSRLNRSPGVWIRLSAPTLRVLDLARRLTVLSGARFDCTLGGQLVARGVLPDHGPERCLCRGTAADIEIGSQRARLRRPVRITLDGIAKGFAVDCAVRAMKVSGARSGWVNAGGDLRVFGEAPLPVAQRQPDGTTRPLGRLRNAALATSHAGGDPDPARPGYIIGNLDASDAAPRSLSVVARFAWRADALTKVAANTPDREREAAVARLGGRLIGESTCTA
jgi:thiamine biosynthesis lipoprotein